MIDAIRCCKVARDRGVSGVLESVSAYTMKHPIHQFPMRLPAGWWKNLFGEKGNDRIAVDQ